MPTGNDVNVQVIHRLTGSTTAVDSDIDSVNARSAACFSSHVPDEAEEATPFLAFEILDPADMASRDHKLMTWS